MVNSSECVFAEFSGHVSVPQNRIGRHFDLISANESNYLCISLTLLVIL